MSELMEKKTLAQYRKVIALCSDLFLKKFDDYGTAWRILRLPSITDQIFIKAKRIRTIQEKGEQKIGDSIRSEFLGIINYCIMALIQFDLQDSPELNLSKEDTRSRYNDEVEAALNLLDRKNHDYGEAWRDMRISSMTDIILMKLLRIKQIEDNSGQTLVSEGVDANYRDIINYSAFCLILDTEAQQTGKAEELKNT